MINCVQCDKETKNPKFCCRSCAAKWTNKNYPKKKTKKKCLKCEEKCKSWRHSRCEKHHEEYKQESINRKKMTIKEYINKESIKGKHPSWKYAHIRGVARNQHKELLKQPCHNCGYSKHVELCHIKGIADFDENTTLEIVNHPTNVIQLCPNCHWELDNGFLKVGTVGIEPTLTPITVSRLEDESGTFPN